MSLRMSSKEMTRLRTVELANIHESVRLHFTSEKFDAIKYKFNRGITEDKLLSRKDTFSITKMAKRLHSIDNGIEYCVGNAIAGETWFPSFTEENMLKYQKSIQSLGHNLQQDCSKLAEKYSLDECLKSAVSDYPLVVNKQMEGEINFETVIVLQKLTGFLDHANKKVQETLLWPDLYRRYKKYLPFVIFDEERIKKIVLDAFLHKNEDVMEDGIVTLPWKLQKAQNESISLL